MLSFTFLKVIPTNIIEDDEMPLSPDATPCLICLENGGILVKLKDLDFAFVGCECNPVFHETCIVKWVERNQTCPICRKPLVSSSNNCICQVNTTVNNHIRALRLFRIFFIVASINFVLNLMYHTYLIYLHVTYFTNDSKSYN